MIDVKSEDFGSKVKKILDDLEMPRIQLSRELGIAKTYLYDILEGSRKAYPVRRRIVEFLEQEQEKRGAYK